MKGVFVIGAVIAAAAAVIAVVLTRGGEGASPGGHARPLPAAICSQVYYDGPGSPDRIITSDLPVKGSLLQAPAVIRYVLQQHDYRAGDLRIGYQVCDEATAATAPIFSPARCRFIASQEAADLSVIGVIAPLGSGCSMLELAELNRAPGGPVATISFSNTYVGLTHRGPHTGPAEPGRYYPTGKRNYVRLVAADDVQGAADALVAKRLGVRRAFVMNDGNPFHTGIEAYGPGIAADFAAAARRDGIAVVGSATVTASLTRRTIPLRYPGLVARVRRARADGVFLAIGDAFDSGRLIKDLRRTIGPRLQLLAPDSYFATGSYSLAGPAAEGMTVSTTILPSSQLPPAGRSFAKRLRRVLGATPDAGSIVVAQATDVLLAAIAASDGSRRSVTSELLRTKMRDGLIGDFGFDPNGDVTSRSVTIYRVSHGRLRVFEVLRPN